jgi:hypothetical protein
VASGLRQNSYESSYQYEFSYEHEFSYRVFKRDRRDVTGEWSSAVFVATIVFWRHAWTAG